MEQSSVEQPAIKPSTTHCSRPCVLMMVTLSLPPGMYQGELRMIQNTIYPGGQARDDRREWEVEIDSLSKGINLLLYNKKSPVPRKCLVRIRTNKQTAISVDSCPVGGDKVTMNHIHMHNSPSVAPPPPPIRTSEG